MKTYVKTVGEALERSGISLETYDKISPDVQSSVAKEMAIHISRAYPVTIMDGGQASQIYTTKGTVGEILAQENIVLNTFDLVEPFIGAQTREDDVIQITRIKEEIVKEIYQIPFVTEVILNPEIEDDETLLIQEGKMGSKAVELKLRYENDQLVARHFVSEAILEEPLNTIKHKGTEELLVTSRGVPFRYSKVIICEATAYDLSYESCGKYPGDPAYGITYTGTYARPGVIAVDPRVIPLHSKVYVASLDRTPDYGFAVAEDTGSAIKGHKIDLFINSNREALRYGRRKVKVFIIDDLVAPSLIKGYGK
jgi:3D (Asp-Asp-Asp) domain-containing protein